MRVFEVWISGKIRFFEEMESAFAERLEAAHGSRRRLLCVGLDPAIERMPEGVECSPEGIFTFSRAIVEATADWACAFKPQFAYYAAAGALGALQEIIRFIRSHYPDKLVILDSKRGDIGATAERYAQESFEVYGADAVTVNPYMGGDTLEPFLRHPGRGAFCLCKTSNAGSGDLQDLQLAQGGSLFERVAQLASGEWNSLGNCGLVVGATYPEPLAKVRELAPDLPILLPGIGAQGGDLQKALAAGLNSRGTGLLINSSRGILYASSGPDFAEAAGREARRIARAIDERRSA